MSVLFVKAFFPKEGSLLSEESKPLLQPCKVPKQEEACELQILC